MKLKTTVERETLVQFLAQELQVARFRDYCPNGLQVEGRNAISRIVSGVTACQALLDQAVALNADAVLVHHGYFWRGEDMRLVGYKMRRIHTLMTHSMSLFAYHLPLDAHPVFGNNAQLAARLGLQHEGHFGEDNLGWLGQVNLPNMKTVGQFATHVEAQLGRRPTLIGDPDQALGKVAWCTGAAHNMLAQAIEAGASLYLSGEISEPTVHLARESQVAYLACGHHATERYGVQALGELLQERFGIEHHFVDIDNPV